MARRDTAGAAAMAFPLDNPQHRRAWIWLLDEEPPDPRHVRTRGPGQGRDAFGNNGNRDSSKHTETTRLAQRAAEALSLPGAEP